MIVCEGFMLRRLDAKQRAVGWRQHEEQCRAEARRETSENG